MRNVQHQFIIKIIDVFENDETSIEIIQEYCEGGDLDKYLKRLNKTKKTLPEGQVAFWFNQICCAIQYMHE